MADETITEAAKLLASLTTAHLPTAAEPWTLVPSSLKEVNLSRYMPNPLRVHERLRFTDTESFIAYVNEYAGASTPKLFATRLPTSLKVECIFDYHHVEMGGSNTLVPHWGEHTATLELEYSEDFGAWLRNNGKWFAQTDFADFVEDYTHLFTDPTGAAMLELAQELAGRRSVNWRSGRRLADGQQRLEYVEELTATGAKGDILVPERLKLWVAIFHKGDNGEMQAAFRWRMNDGKVTFAYKLLQVQEQIDVAVEVALAAITENTKLPVLLGKVLERGE